MTTKGPLHAHMVKRPHGVIFIESGTKYHWLCYKRDDGVKELICAYSRKRDCVRALRQAGYKQHGSSWSLPLAKTEETPTRPTGTVLVFEGESEPVEMAWPFPPSE